MAHSLDTAIARLERAQEAAIKKKFEVIDDPDLTFDQKHDVLRFYLFQYAYVKGALRHLYGIREESS